MTKIHFAVAFLNLTALLKLQLPVHVLTEHQLHVKSFFFLLIGVIMTIETETRLQDHVQHIANTITNGFGDELNSDDQEMSAFDYLQDALDIEYIVNSKREYLGARVLVAFGGPNIWINTRTKKVEGYWWNESASASFDDGIDLDSALEELWNC
jgi:hypothetical protein